jgi:hypothetical protein
VFMVMLHHTSLFLLEAFSLTDFWLLQENSNPVAIVNRINLFFIAY